MKKKLFFYCYNNLTFQKKKKKKHARYINNCFCSTKSNLRERILDTNLLASIPFVLLVLFTFNNNKYIYLFINARYI